MTCPGCGAEVDGACFECEVRPAMGAQCERADHDCWEGCDGAQCAPAFVDADQVATAPQGEPR